jgi:hypothetical protein
MIAEIDKAADFSIIGYRVLCIWKRRAYCSNAEETTERTHVAGCEPVTKLLPNYRRTMKNILTLVIVVSFATVAYSNAVDGQRSLHYEPETVELEGKLVVQSKYGPPNFGEEPKTDQKVRIPVLVLKTPVNVLPIQGRDEGINAEPVYRVRQIQLSFAVGETEHKKLIGKDVVVKGTLFRAHTGHHYTDVVLTVRSVGEKIN